MEREKLFYDLHQTIKEVSKHEESAYSDFCDKITWIRKLTGEISQMKQENLSIVLDIYSRLPKYTPDSIEFIIRHAGELKDIFYIDGEFVEKNIELLYNPYIESLIESPIITLYCFNNNISSSKTWNIVLRCICISKTTIENLLLGIEVPNREIINSLPLLFELNVECSNFAKIINEKAGPLHKMQMDIHKGYSTTSKKDARNTYIKFLVKNIRDEETINRVIEYINTHEFDKTKTLNEICNLDVNYPDKLKASCKSNILVFPAFKELYKYSPKIAERLFELYSTNKIKIKEFEKLVHSFLDFDESQIEIIEKLL